MIGPRKQGKISSLAYLLGEKEINLEETSGGKSRKLIPGPWERNLSGLLTNRNI